MKQEEEKETTLQGAGSMRQEFMILKKKAKDEALGRLSQLLTSIQQTVTKTVMDLIENKVDELERTVMKHYQELTEMRMELERMKLKLDEGIENPKKKAITEEKLTLAHSELTHLIGQKEKEYRNSNVAVGVEIDVKRAAEAVVREMGIEVLRTQEWVVRKGAGVDLGEHVRGGSEIRKVA